MRLTALLSFTAILSFPFAFVVLAEQGRPQSTTPLDPVIAEEIRVQLFHVNFMAVDKRGRPVTDLKPNEVVVLDRGAEQEIAVLEPYYTPAETTPASAAEEGTPPDGRPAAPAADRGRWIILLFDNFASRLPDRVTSIEAALELVDGGLDSRDLVAVVSFNGELHVLQSFTADIERLRQALHEAYGHADRVVTDRHDQLTQLMRDLETCRGEALAGSCARRLSGSYEDERRREADAIMTALTQLLRSVASIPGPKTLVFFSSGFARSSTADPTDAARAVLGEAVADRMVFGQEFRLDDWQDDLAAAASRARVSVFTLNPGGSVASPLISAERAAPLGRQNTFQIDVFRRSDQNSQASLAEIARRTGGTAIESRNALGALRGIIEQTEGLYTVGYYPNRATPSAPHALKIKIKRRGVKAVWPREVPHLRPVRVLRGGMSVEAGECSGGRRVVSVRVGVDLESLTFERLQDRVVNNFSIYVTLQEGDGVRTLYRDYRMFNINHSRDEFPDAEDPVIEHTLTAPCRPLTVRASVADATGGAQAEFEQPLAR